jgi:hypothetical protein
MFRRIVGAVLIMLGTFIAYMGIWSALVMTEFSLKVEVTGSGLSQRC